MVGLDLVLVSRHGRFRISIKLDKVPGGVNDRKQSLIYSASGTSMIQYYDE